MRILAFSDLHRNKDAAMAIVAVSGDADVVIGAGDFATLGNGIDDCFEALRVIRKPMIVVCGNHDRLHELQAACAPLSQAQVLHGDSIEIGGVTFHGVGYEIPGTSKALLESQLDEASGEQLLRACPIGAVLVTHSPPFGIADVQRNGSHDGSRAILAVLEHQRPRLHLCGHIHNSWGRSGTVGACPVHNLGPTANWFTV